MKSWIFPVILFLAIGGVFLYQRHEISSLRHELEKTRVVVGSLPSNVVTQSILEDNVLRLTKRIEGTDSVIVETQYVPVESSVIHTVKIDSTALSELETAQIQLAELEESMLIVADTARVEELRQHIENLQRMLYTTKVDFDTHGWCLEPCFVGGIDSNVEGVYGGGARLYYLNRFGLGVQGTVNENQTGSVGGFFDYRVPKHETLAPYVSGDYDFNSEKIKGEIGIHVYF